MVDISFDAVPFVFCIVFISVHPQSSAVFGSIGRSIDRPGYIVYSNMHWIRHTSFTFHHQFSIASINSQVLGSFCHFDEFFFHFTESVLFHWPFFISFSFHEYIVWVCAFVLGSFYFAGPQRIYRRMRDITQKNTQLTNLPEDKIMK